MIQTGDVNATGSSDNESPFVGERFSHCHSDSLAGTRHDRNLVQQHQIHTCLLSS